jgi:hypothetical protein
MENTLDNSTLNIYLPLITGLVGALIGSITSVIIITVQSHYQNKKVSQQLAVNSAIEEYKTHVGVTPGDGSGIYPLSLYIWYKAETIKLLDKNNLTPKSLIKLNEKYDELKKVIEDNSYQ